MIAATTTPNGDRIPIIICDECHAPTCDPAMAMAVMPAAEEKPLQILQVLHVHKDDCYDALERQQSHCLPWVELQEYLLLLSPTVEPHQAK